MEIQKYTRLTLFIALSVVLNLVESVIPFFSGFIPGLKLGLANIVILLVLYVYSMKDALYVSVVRVILVGIIRTGLFSMAFFFSLVGGILSVLTMGIAKKTKLSIIGVSVIGSIFHSIGQILVAIFILNSFNIVYYLPLLILFSIPTGIVVGFITKSLIKYYNRYLEND